MMAQLEDTIAPVSSSLTSAAILRLLIHWCLEYLDQLLAVTFASEIAFTKLWMSNGQKIIEDTVSRLSESKWKIHRENAENRVVEFLKLMNMEEGGEESEELRALLDKEVPSWREFLKQPKMYSDKET